MTWRKKTLRLQTGRLRFTVPRPDGVDIWEADVVLLKLTIEEIESRHKLRVDAKHRYVSTPEFLADLCQAFVGLGMPRCTPTLAHQVWVAAAEQFRLVETRFRRALGKLR